jgi:type I restriction enzyme, S subunit
LNDGGLGRFDFPLHVQRTRIHTSEALYQACRFPHLPEVQRLIIGQASPMTAKMKSSRIARIRELIGIVCG